MRLMKHIPSGDLYPWTPQLATRDDMVEVGSQPALEPAQEVASDDQPIQLQPEEIPTENSESASADAELPPLDDAIESFRRQASKSAKKAAGQENG